MVEPECEEGETHLVSPDPCGINGRGTFEKSCEANEWRAPACNDPDECQDGEISFVECSTAKGMVERRCIEGSWKRDVCRSIQRVSVSSEGAEGNTSSSNRYGISADGSRVVYASEASNLVPGDTNDVRDIFLHDITDGSTVRVSLTENGEEAADRSTFPAISRDGSRVAFSAADSEFAKAGVHGIFMRDLEADTITHVSVSLTGSVETSDGFFAPSFSASGEKIVFSSTATNLVEGDEPEEFSQPHLFVRDLKEDTTTRVTVNSNETQADERSNSGSFFGDGRYVAFESFAANLVDGDTNDSFDCFIRDMQEGTTTRVSVNSDEEQGRDAGSGLSQQAVSDDGRYVVFGSLADNLDANDYDDYADVFVRDTLQGTTRRISNSFEGGPSDGDSGVPTISADGRFAAFSSSATNLVPGDTNDRIDVFVHDLETGETSRLSVAEDGSEANGTSKSPEIAADGTHVVFWSDANNLVPDDTNGARDIFVARVPFQ